MLRTADAAPKVFPNMPLCGCVIALASEYTSSSTVAVAERTSVVAQIEPSQLVNELALLRLFASRSSWSHRPDEAVVVGAETVLEAVVDVDAVPEAVVDVDVVSETLVDVDAVAEAVVDVARVDEGAVDERAVEDKEVVLDATVDAVDETDDDAELA